MILREGEEIPKFYGFAYMCPDLLAYRVYPMPFNWIVRLWHEKVRYFFIGMPNKNERRLFNFANEMRRKGFSDGHARGYQRGLEDGYLSAAHDKGWNDAVNAAIKRLRRC